jgi:hypothetical protein
LVRKTQPDSTKITVSTMRPTNSAAHAAVPTYMVHVSAQLTQLRYSSDCKATLQVHATVQMVYDGLVRYLPIVNRIKKMSTLNFVLYITA